MSRSFSEQDVTDFLNWLTSGDKKLWYGTVHGLSEGWYLGSDLIEPGQIAVWAGNWFEEQGNRGTQGDAENLANRATHRVVNDGNSWPRST